MQWCGLKGIGDKIVATKKIATLVTKDLAFLVTKDLATLVTKQMTTLATRLLYAWIQPTVVRLLSEKGKCKLRLSDDGRQHWCFSPGVLLTRHLIPTHHLCCRD